MAKKKRTIVEEELPEDLTQQVAAPTDEELDIESFIDELGDSAVNVYLSRYDKEKGRFAWLATMPVDEFSQDNVARQWGGGRYMARVKNSDGRFFKGASRVFFIDESIKPTRAGEQPGGNGVTGFERELLLKLVTERSGGSDIAGQMQAIATIAASQASAMMTAMTPLLAKITELASGGGKGGAIGDLIAAVELGTNLSGTKDEGYLPVIREVGVPLVKALEQYFTGLKGRNARPAPATSIQPGVGHPPGPGTPREVAPPADNPAAPQAPPWVQMLAPYIPKVIDFAVHGGDPNVVAGLVYSSNPPMARLLEDMVEQAGFSAQLLQTFPGLQAHAAWVDQFLDEFRGEEIGEEIEPVTADQGEGDGDE